MQNKGLEQTHNEIDLSKSALACPRHAAERCEHQPLALQPARLIRTNGKYPYFAILFEFNAKITLKLLAGGALPPVAAAAGPGAPRGVTRISFQLQLITDCWLRPYAFLS